MAGEWDAAEVRAAARPWWRRWLSRDPYVMWWPCRPTILGQTGKPVTRGGQPLVAFRLSQVRGMRAYFRAAVRDDEGIDPDRDVTHGAGTR